MSSNIQWNTLWIDSRGFSVTQQKIVGNFFEIFPLKEKLCHQSCKNSRSFLFETNWLFIFKKLVQKPRDGIELTKLSCAVSTHMTFSILMPYTCLYLAARHIILVRKSLSMSNNKLKFSQTRTHQLKLVQSLSSILT